MTKMLYTNIERMKYIAVADNEKVFIDWCSKWQIAPEDIFLITFSKESNAEVVPAIKTLDNFSLILFDNFMQIEEVDEYLAFFLFHRATYHHDITKERPKTVGGRIINWLPDDLDKADADFWTPAKEKYLRYLYPYCSLPQMVILLRCTLPGLKRAIARLRLNEVAAK